MVSPLEFSYEKGNSRFLLVFEPIQTIEPMRVTIEGHSYRLQEDTGRLFLRNQEFFAGLDLSRENFQRRIDELARHLFHPLQGMGSEVDPLNHQTGLPFFFM